MLPAPHRLRRSDDFAAVLKGGRRAGRTTLVVHTMRTERAGVARAGLVVSKKVGNSVIRHRVSRRLRALLADRLATLPDGTDVVVRVLPAAATSASHVLGDDLDSALRRTVAGAGR